MLNKKIAQKILSEIKKSKNILLALHVSPDEDCLASVLGMDLVLRKMRKKTRMISYSQINNRMNYFYQFPAIERIEIFDFAKVDFSEFDLFIALDAAQERMITRNSYPKFPKNLKVINIDHHVTNPNFGDINLVVGVSSTSELLYQLFKLWRIRVDRTLATMLFGGIFADTGCFQYPMTSSLTLRIAADLIEKGASLDKAVLDIFRSYNLKTLKYWGRILDNMQMDKGGKFIWSKISQEEKEELEIQPTDIENASSLFAPIVLGTEFGIILVEENPGLVRGTMRARGNFDVSKIALELGGGGHKAAAGFSLSMSLPEAEEKVLETARISVGKNI